MFDSKKPTALFIGRYQPFHAGHRALVLEGIRRHGQALLAVRDTHGSDDGKNPLTFEQVRERILDHLGDVAHQIEVVQVPNIAGVYYGRDVGYAVERLHLDPELEAVSATEIRRQEGI